MMQKYKGAVWNTLGSAMYGINSFVMLALVGRIGSIEQTGYFGIAFTTAQLLYIVGLFGVPHYHMTDYEEKYSFSSYAKGRFISCILMLLCCVAAIAALGFTGLKRSYTICLTALMLLNVVGELYQSLFFQKNRLDYSGSALFYRTFWSLLAFSAVLLFCRDILWAVLAQTMVNLLASLYYALAIAPRFITPGVEGRQEDSAYHLLKECLPLAVSLFLMNVAINMPKYGIELMMDDVTQGYYNMIFIPAQVINLCGQFLFKPYLNRYSRFLNEGSFKEFWNLILKQLLLISLFTLLCCIGTYLIGAQALGLVYGKDLLAFKLPLTMVIVGGGMFAVCQMFYFILLVIRQQRQIFIVYTLSLPVSALLSLLLIVVLDINGAVLAFILTHVVIALHSLYYMFRFTRQARGTITS